MGKKRRIGFQGGGMDAGTPGGGFGMGVGPDSVGGNPSGTGDTGLGGSGTVSSKSGTVKSKFGPVKAPGSLRNRLSQLQRRTAMEENMAQLAEIEANPNLSMADYNPNTAGGLNPTAGLTLGQSLGFTGAQLGEALGNISPGSMIGSLGAMAAGLPGIVGSVLGGALFGGEEDDTSIGPTMADVTNDQQSFLDQVASMFGPTSPMEPDRGGNKPILPIETPPTSEELITQNPLMPMMTDQQRLAMLYRLPTGGITNFLT